MKTSSKLLIGLPIVVLLAIALCLEIAGEYQSSGIVSGTQVSAQSGRVPAFSIITIKGRAFSAQKAEVTEEEQETYTSSHVSEKKSALFPIAYKLISRGLASAK